MHKLFCQHLCFLCALIVVGCVKQSDESKSVKALEATPATKALASSKQEFKPKPPPFSSTPRKPPVGKYHGNVKTKILHGATCPNYNCPNCSAGFKSIRQARRKGYHTHSCIKKKSNKRRHKRLPTGRELSR